VGAALARRFDPMPKAETCWILPTDRATIANDGPNDVFLSASEPPNRLPRKISPGWRVRLQWNGKSWQEIA